MGRFLVLAGKLVMASSGPACGLYAINLFEKYVALGTQVQDATHTVLVNSHGAYRYITESQHQHFLFYLWAGISLSLLMMAAIVISKIKE